MTKITQYIETRFHNSAETGSKISTKNLLRELRHKFGVDIRDAATKEMITKLIRRTRQRVRQQQLDQKNKFREWSQILSVPETLMQKWYRSGLVTNKKTVKILATILNDIRSPQAPSETI